MLYNAGIYCRLSKDDYNSVHENLSIRSQMDITTAYVQSNGWVVYDYYVDDGFSGVNFERPSFKRMIEDIKEDKINLIVTKDLSRFGRNYIETGDYLENFFPENNIRFIAVHDCYDSNNANNYDIVPFKNIFNEWYSKQTSQKSRSAKKSHAQSGKFLGSRAPYGYIKNQYNKHKLVVDNEAAKNVEYIFRLYSEGNSARSIADILNKKSIDCPNIYYQKNISTKIAVLKDKNLWGSATVMNILRNGVYIGNLVQGKSETLSYKNKKRIKKPNEQWIVVENTHKPIIDRNLWDSVQKIINSSHKIRTKKDKTASILSGLVKCGDCGAKMTFTTKKKGDRVYQLYRCSRYANNGSHACSTHGVDADKVETLIFNSIKAYIQDLEGGETKFKAELIKSCFDIDYSEYRKKLKLLRRRMEEIDENLKTCFEDKCKGIYSDEIMSLICGDYQSEKERINNEINYAERILGSKDSAGRNVFEFSKLLKAFKDEKALSRSMAVALINHIAIYEYKDGGDKYKKYIVAHYNHIRQEHTIYVK